jgi:hypothetical protein
MKLQLGGNGSSYVADCWECMEDFFTLIKCVLLQCICVIILSTSFVGTLSTVIFHEPSQGGMDTEVDWWGRILSLSVNDIDWV